MEAALVSEEAAAEAEAEAEAALAPASSIPAHVQAAEGSTGATDAVDVGYASSPVKYRPSKRDSEGWRLFKRAGCDVAAELGMAPERDGELYWIAEE